MSRRATRSLRYFAIIAPTRSLRFPFWIFERICCRFRKHHGVDGMMVIDLTPDSKYLELFLERVTCALKLVSRVDLLRYGRIKAEINVIANSYAFSAAGYWRLGKMCTLDFGKLCHLGDDDFITVIMANLLVHEATHGLLDRKRIPYTKKLRTRIESICNREMLKFSRHLKNVEGGDWEEIVRTWIERPIQRNTLSFVGRLKYVIQRLKDQRIRP